MGQKAGAKTISPGSKGTNDGMVSAFAAFETQGLWLKPDGTSLCPHVWGQPIQGTRW